MTAGFVDVEDCVCGENGTHWCPRFGGLFESDPAEPPINKDMPTAQVDNDGDRQPLLTRMYQWRWGLR